MNAVSDAAQLFLTSRLSSVRRLSVTITNCHGVAVTTKTLQYRSVLINTSCMSLPPVMRPFPDVLTNHGRYIIKDTSCPKIHYSTWTSYISNVTVSQNVLMIACKQMKVVDWRGCRGRHSYLQYPPVLFLPIRD